VAIVLQHVHTSTDGARIVPSIAVSFKSGALNKLAAEYSATGKATMQLQCATRWHSAKDMVDSLLAHKKCPVQAVNSTEYTRIANNCKQLPGLEDEDAELLPISDLLDGPEHPDLPSSSNFNSIFTMLNSDALWNRLDEFPTLNES
jgi:hypothetical protein